MAAFKFQFEPRRLLVLVLVPLMLVVNLNDRFGRTLSLPSSL